MIVRTTVKSIQDIMRQDVGVDGDAQRISQLCWMFFLKIIDDQDQELEATRTGYRSPIPDRFQWRAWAALSTSGLRSLDLPHDVRDVIVLADGDEAGEAAARDCARRWKRDGRRVRIARPPQGMDFNDLLKACTPAITEGAR